jgi:hypothetical protein
VAIDTLGLLYALALLVALLLWLLQKPEARWRPGRLSALLKGWRWRGTAPLPFVVLKWAFWLSFISTFVILGTIPKTSRVQPDTDHPLAFRMRDGKVHYVARWYQHVMPVGLTMGCGLALAMGVVAWRNRTKLERYQLAGQR